MTERIDFKSMTPEELTAWCKDQGQPAFRGKQLFQWLSRGVASTEEMTDVPKALRAKIDQAGGITPPVVARKQVSKLDGTIKYLWQLADGNCIETVLMRYRHGNSVCISSQVGCAMGCAFCASTVGGKIRNLTAGELLDQVIFTQKDSGAPISNIVLMGIGEPLDNYANVRKFLTLVNHPNGMNIGMRHISLRPDQGHRPAGGGEFTAHAVRFPPRPRRRDPQQTHARQPGHGGGCPLRGLPPVFPKDGAAHLV